MVCADSFGNALGNSIVGAIQDHHLEKQTDSILEEAGFSGEKGDTQQSRIAVRAMLEAGGAPEQIQQILAREDIRNAYDRLDAGTRGGISIEEAADRALANAPGSSLSEYQEIPGETPEFIITAGRGPLSGEGIFSETIGGGVELLDSFSSFYQENELLATIGFAGVSAVIGGPTKTFLKRLTGDLGNSLVERGAEAFGGLTARVVSDIAIKNKWTVALSIAGFSGEADASIIGTAAGGLGSIAVETALGAGAGQVVDRVKDLRNAITGRQARREVMRQQGIPTSQAPIYQSRNDSGWEYRYEVPKAGGGVELKSVQQQTLDRSHPGQGHYEAGRIKIDPLTGEIRLNDYDRAKLTNDKSKIDYDDDN